VKKLGEGLNQIKANATQLDEVNEKEANETIQFKKKKTTMYMIALSSNILNYKKYFK
jgi:hypothetical protein